MAIKTIFYEQNELKISYDFIDKNSNQTILIIHGWGSNKELMSLALKDICINQIYIDLPGFGKSSVPFRAFDSIDYTMVVREFMKACEYKIDFVLGHSYGGKISVLLTKTNLKKQNNDFIPCDDFDNDIKLILLSSAGIRIEKSFTTKLKISIFKILKKLGFSFLQKAFISKDAQGMSSVMYETFKKVVDEDISNILSSTKNHTLLLWGKKDTATPLICANAFKSLLQNSSLHIIDEDHFFFLKEKQNCVKLINSFILDDKI